MIGYAILICNLFLFIAFFYKYYLNYKILMLIERNLDVDIVDFLIPDTICLSEIRFRIRALISFPFFFNNLKFLYSNTLNNIFRKLILTHKTIYIFILVIAVLIVIYSNQ